MIKELKVMTAVAVNSVYLLECDLVQPDRNLQAFGRKALLHSSAPEISVNEASIQSACYLLPCLTLLP